MKNSKRIRIYELTTPLPFSDTIEVIKRHQIKEEKKKKYSMLERRE